MAGGFADGAVEDVAFPHVVLHGRNDLERFAAKVDLTEPVVAVVAGRPDAADFADVAAVAVATGTDEIADLVARLLGECGQEPLARAGRREQCVDAGELLQAAPALVG